MVETATATEIERTAPPRTLKALRIALPGLEQLAEEKSQQVKDADEAGREGVEVMERAGLFKRPVAPEISRIQLMVRNGWLRESIERIYQCYPQLHLSPEATGEIWIGKRGRHPKKLPDEVGVNLG